MNEQSDYWYRGYYIENIPSKALERILSNIDNCTFDQSIDIGCGMGRNIPLLLRVSKKITAIDDNSKVIECVRKKFKQVGAYIMDIQDLNNFYHERFDFGVAWRILHLGDDTKRKKTINCLIDIMKDDSYLAVAVSSRKCPSYKQKILKDARIISPGTIIRINERGIHDTRHYFTEREIEKLNPMLSMEDMFIFDELSGNGKKLKNI